MTTIRQFDERSMRMIGNTVIALRRQIHRLQYNYQRDRVIFPSGGAPAPITRGKPTATIAGGSDGQITVWTSAGEQTGQTEDCHNPYSISLEPEYFVRLVTVDGWDKPFAVPDEFVACIELAPDLVAPVVGS